MRTKLYRFLLQFNNEFALEREEKLIFLIMLMPVELSLFEYTNTNHTIIDLAECLVEPLFLDGCFYLININ